MGRNMCKLMTSMIGMALVVWTGVHAQAGIVLNATRLVYPAQHKEAVLSVLNKNRSTILLQSWLEAEDPADGELPFAVVPPLVPLSGGGRQTVRIIHSGAEMPTDRESLFWLNVQEIPQASEQENVLQIGIRQRIKVLYRPRQIMADPEQAPRQLRWRLKPDGTLVVSNTGPFHVSLVDIELFGVAGRLIHRKNAMLAPGQAQVFELPAPVTEQQARLSFKSINDHGAVVPYQLSSRDWKTGQALWVEN
ncbi:molecular chaperone [Pseudomonas gingeri]|uniref:Molecular chaperone n=2 Tax=Pseudomonas gingeri TaxID=117681 RepID=A0A7Y7YFQ4_9PSED|nr:molecular chaperone [Pseudomonas gingeri]NWC35573.1 molecular chaperone [Pseudomonas gingeri]NWD09016.1 molecular chaperone [Pseudomonas gingeri]NWE34847.1 molecular chaperone [Pseudomonas gingeri]NWE56948.1 molecular chaperone [Pseudomonas gingeri]